MMIEVMASCSPAQWGLSCNRLCCAPISAPQRGNPSSPTSNARTNESRRVLESGVRGNPPAPFGRGERPQGPTYPYHIFRCNKPTKGHIIGVFMQPTEKGLKRMKQKIKEMTDKKTLNDDYLHKLEAINSLVQGWASYYRPVNPSRTFDKLDRSVWIRLRRWLQKKYRISSLQVRKQYMRHRSGPEGGYAEFAAQDEEGEWIWRARATRTKLIHYRPSWKRHWPNPYLEKKRAEHFVLPTLKNIWHGNREAPIYAANRREALKRAKGCCERCGKATKLFTHHKNRVKTGKRKPIGLRDNGEPGAGKACTPGSAGRMRKRALRKECNAPCPYPIRPGVAHHEKPDACGLRAGLQCAGGRGSG